MTADFIVEDQILSYLEQYSTKEFCRKKKKKEILLSNRSVLIANRAEYTGNSVSLLPTPQGKFQGCSIKVAIV